MKNDEDALLAKELYNTHAEDYFKKASEYPAISFVRKFVSSLIDKPKGKLILFAGCGDCQEASPLIPRGAKIYGIDISEKCIDLARNNFPDQNFEVMDFEETTFNKNKFDDIVCIFALMYKKSLYDIYSEFKRILKPNGQIIVVLPHQIRKMIKYTNMNYFVSGRQSEIWKGNERFNYYRTIEEYINPISKTGLILENLYEPKIPKEFEESGMEINHPHHLILVIKKTGEQWH